MSSSSCTSSAITEFSGDNRFLSNFWPCEVLYEGIVYPSVEHAYQAAKSDCHKVRIDIASCATAGAAKKCGRHVALRPDWEAVKIDVMERLLRLKFANEYLRSRLLLTGDAQLMEGNWWGDRFWGVCNGVGENWLGKLLMKVRDAIRSEQAPPR